MGLLTRTTSIELYDEQAAAFADELFDPKNDETLAIVHNTELTKIGQAANAVLRVVGLSGEEIK